MDSKTLDLVNKTIPEFNNELAEHSQEKENVLIGVDPAVDGSDVTILAKMEIDGNTHRITGLDVDYAPIQRKPIRFEAITEIGLGVLGFVEEMTKRCRREKEEHFLKENRERIIDGDFRGNKRYRRRQVMLRNSHYTRVLIRKDDFNLSSAARRPHASALLITLVCLLWARDTGAKLLAINMRTMHSFKDS